MGSGSNPSESRSPSEEESLPQRIRCLKSPDIRIVGFAKTLELKVCIAKV